ncbi:hypothetical protein BU24DRAFT_406371 [Aaosphaeria arxii CBS 175.79]|uniref:Uncharacterized protein n=1 Tax=Aaosphaeria arxii CBS 175.79 TaxID=1450172 RepID=A0A6A5Y4D1_9PLEO|nr:uncharacterized protein BU24DRAFT_406371 [Aaosphaeria arxii CBS 175.79]KAF2019741.1 hypothetical protein BU24DRAFT_406371 [Aaosphaeria arxii CBS 175.79]
MDKQAQDDDTQNSGSIVSGLTSLGSGDDDFERLMLQNERDQRQLKDALRGDFRPFSKARSHPHVGLTLDNLERNNAQQDSRSGAGYLVKRESPQSSNGSARADPPIHAPREWGRKGRVKRNWLRAIASEDQTRSPEAPNHFADEETPRQSSYAPEDLPLPSIEDSPLSHKGSSRNTPNSTRRKSFDTQEDSDLDSSIDFNEASLIASTPYVPRSTVLDDIRQREMETLREQALTTNRLDRIRETSPEETRPRSSSKQFPDRSENLRPAQALREGTPEARVRMRRNSWKTIGKSPAVIGEGGQQPTISPITVYNTNSEGIEIVEARAQVNARPSPQRPGSNKREDSHELLRRLARVSNTPSPGRPNAQRPQTAPAKQSESPSPLTLHSKHTTNISQPHKHSPESTAEPIPAHQKRGRDTQSVNTEAGGGASPVSIKRQESVDIEATPVPTSSKLSATTPRVTGAWVDTPAPRTIPRSARSQSNSPVRPPKPEDPSNSSHGKQGPEIAQAESEGVYELERTRPSMPGSALEAIVEEARANGKRAQDQDSFGDSTINSLEELIRPGSSVDQAGDIDDDTLLGLQLPTEPPRNEAERQRQQELTQLHLMNQRLRAARTSVRDASRGMTRVEHRVEHIEENGEKIRVIYRDCPCAGQGHHGPWTIAWTNFKHLFRDPQVRRRAGLTWLSIMLITLFTWYLTECIACEQYCHKLYASSMIGYGVDPNAPRFPFVIPTLLYRWTIKPWWPFVWSYIGPIVLAIYQTIIEDEAVKTSATATARGFATTILQRASATDAFESDFRISDDEMI